MPEPTLLSTGHGQRPLLQAPEQGSTGLLQALGLGSRLSSSESPSLTCFEEGSPCSTLKRTTVWLSHILALTCGHHLHPFWIPLYIHSPPVQLFSWTHFPLPSAFLSLCHSDQPHCLCVGDLCFSHPKHKSGYFIWRLQARVEVSCFQEPACTLESSAKVLPMLICEGVLLLESWEVPALVSLQSSLLWPGLGGLGVISPFGSDHPPHPSPLFLQDDSFFLEFPH